MKLGILFSLFVVLVGCQVNSIRPSGGGLDMDIKLSSKPMRHGWAYFSKPHSTELTVRDEASVERGRQLFLQHCQKCHGADGKGKGPLAEALKLKPANLTLLPNEVNSSYLLVQINEGKGSMPQWKDLLTHKQTSDLTNYLRELASSGK